MDRTQAFVEYGRILQELDDSLTGGFRRPHEELEIYPPQFSQNQQNQPVTDPSQLAGSQETQPSSSTAAPIDSPPELHGHRQVVTPVPSSETPNPGVAFAPASPDPAASAELSGIAGEISKCQNCTLYLLREHTVPGIGFSGATLMVVTQAPTDMAGPLSSPLAAYEHEYMEKWIKALGLDTIRDVYITPSVKCRTPGGRPPQQNESNSCNGYLRRQYKAVKPQAILALGASACGALTGNPADFPSLVGRDWTWGAVPALVLWTPAEVLANPGKLRKPVWDALLRLKAAWNAVPGNQL